MKNSQYEKTNHLGSARHEGFSAPWLPMAIVSCVLSGLGMTAAHAQAITGRVFGWAPAGQTITVHSTSGVHRHAKANDRGRYTIGSLPMGTYEVALDKGGKPTDRRSNIMLTVGAGAEVDFACEHDHCAKSESN